MKKLTFFLSILVCNFFFSQENYNLPPGSVLNTKTTFYKDLSYKLNELPDLSKVSNTTKELFIDLSEEKLSEMKINNPLAYDYYIQASDYFKKLSDKVKGILSADEIWYIYQFDQRLKENLIQIK